MKTLAVFDLDETITTRDTFLEFIKYTHGSIKFYAVFVIIAPLAALMAAGLYKNTKLKELVLTWFYKGWRIGELERLGSAFAAEKIPTILNKQIYDKLLWHKQKGHRVILLTASCSVWVRQWCTNENIEIIASELAVVNGRVTGKLQGENCHGIEKKTRLLAHLDISGYDMYAYGNAPSDRHYIELAAHKTYV